jgi:hypothetical protein
VEDAEALAAEAEIKAVKSQGTLKTRRNMANMIE